MKTNTITLEFKDEKGFDITQSDFPRRGTPLFKIYNSIINKLCKNIPQDAGWYIWYNEETKEVQYVGQARKSKKDKISGFSGLKGRILGELYREFACFWYNPSGNNKTEILYKQFFSKYYLRGNYHRETKKFPSNRIIWFCPNSDINNKILDYVENQIIFDILLWKIKKNQETKYPIANNKLMIPHPFDKIDKRFDDIYSQSMNLYNCIINVCIDKINGFKNVN